MWQDVVLLEFPLSMIFSPFPPFPIIWIQVQEGGKKGKRYGLKLQIGDELILILNLERKEFFSYLYE